jgi:hypothetical protein
MTHEPDEQLTPEERSALAALPQTLDPPPQLDQRIERALRQRRLVGPARSVWLLRVAAAAAIALAFAGGWSAHAWTAADGRETESPRYMLLLFGAESAPGEESRRVEEYRAWAASVASSGAHVSGEKLADRQFVFGPLQEPARGDQPLGFFIISAPDDRAAAAVVQTHPHLKHGGRVVVRPIASH